jgi:hypothetical protein
LVLQAYVDHSIVTVIVENQTALTVWVHPSSPNSTAVALFQRSRDTATTTATPTTTTTAHAHAPAGDGDGAAAAAAGGGGGVAVGGPVVASMEVWQMKAMPSTVVP